MIATIAAPDNEEKISPKKVVDGHALKKKAKKRKAQSNIDTIKIHPVYIPRYDFLVLFLLILEDILIYLLFKFAKFKRGERIHHEDRNFPSSF